MNEEVQQLRRINNLLFNAFMLSSQIWMFKSREKMIELFCNIVAEDEGCTAVVVSDKSGTHYRMSEDVFSCKFLNYTPNVFGIIDASYCECKNVSHDYLVVFPAAEGTSVYVFLKNIEEEHVQILKEMVDVLSRAIKHLEIQKENEMVMERLKENLKHFQFLADRLRNPLAVIQGVAELAGEMDMETVFEMVRKSAEKMKEVLDSLSEAEVSSIELYQTLFSKR